MRELATDVLIVGGGTGGCAAALAVTSLGFRAVITEETHWLGGQLTTQVVPPDENIWIESFGCTQRYRKFRSAVRGYYRRHYPLSATARENPRLNPGGGYVSHLCFEPRVGLAALDEQLAWPRAAGLLTVLARTRPVAAQTDHDRVTAVTVEHLDSGARRVITASYVIDATELGDLLPLAGVEYVSGAESQADTGEAHAVAGPPEPENVQAITWCFPMAWDRREGADHTIDQPEQYQRWAAYVPQTDPPAPGRQLSWMISDSHGQVHERALFLRPGHKVEWFRGLWGYRQLVTAQHYPAEQRPDEVTLVNWPQNDYFVHNLIDKPEAQKQLYLEEARQLSLSLLYWMQTQAPRHDGGVGYPQMYLRPDMTGTPDGLAMYPYIRESRRIRAAFTVLEQHVSAAERAGKGAEPFADSVGIGHYSIDLHICANGNNRVGMIPACHFQIPLGALLPQRVKNLLPGGKNLGVTHITNGCFRLHPVEWNIGESAGLLAAFCLGRNTTPHAVRADGKLLAGFQLLLQQQGIDLAWPKVQP